MSRRSILILVLILLACMPLLALAAPAGAPQLPALPNLTVGRIGDAPVSVPLQTLLLMTAITLLPSLLLVMTAFTRIIIVLALLRQALGTGQTPSNQILIGITPVPHRDDHDAGVAEGLDGGFAPYLNGDIDFRTAWTWVPRRCAASCLRRCARPT